MVEDRYTNVKGKYVKNFKIPSPYYSDRIVGLRPGYQFDRSAESRVY